MSQVGPAERPRGALRGQRVALRLTFTLRSARLSSGENRWERKLLIFLTSITALVTKTGGQSEEPSRAEPSQSLNDVTEGERERTRESRRKHESDLRAQQCTAIFVLSWVVEISPIREPVYVL